MHEMAFVRNIMDIVVEEADAAGAEEISAVHLVIGEGRDIVEDFFEGLFQYLARGTVAEHAKVIIRRVPYMVRCARCGFVFHVDVFDPATRSCPACEAYEEYKLVSGLEFYISKIEAPGSAPSQKHPDKARACEGQCTRVAQGEQKEKAVL
jgi:hydrogenase nickel incorporation protein HypA/HybF